jgi:GNAT superfamily N-acetyltransferase
MEHLMLNVEEDPLEADIQTVFDGLRADHTAHGHVRDPKKLAVFVRDTNNRVCGGLIGSTLWGHLIIEKLWVEERLRGHGYGVKLLNAAEEEAVRRGCTYSHSDTFTWQALSFYHKLGYEVYAELRNFPEGHCLHYIRKKLIPDVKTHGRVWD